METIIIIIGTNSSEQTLDPKVRKDLDHQLKHERDKIITFYAFYTSSICESVVSKKIPVEKILHFLTKLPGCAQLFDSLPEEPDMYAVFKQIDKIASYLHYEIYQSILNKYFTTSEKDSDDLKYSEYLKAYIERLDIKHFLKINSELVNLSDTKELCIKIDMDETTKITRIKDLESRIATILGEGLRPSDLILIDVKEGCLILTFLIPATAADAIFARKFTTDQIERFRSISILWLKCEEYEIECIKSDDITSLKDYNTNSGTYHTLYNYGK